MSWGVTLTSTFTEELSDKVQEAFDSNYSEPTEGTVDQMLCATASAQAFAEEMGAKAVSANLGGHVHNNDATSRISVSVEKLS